MWNYRIPFLDISAKPMVITPSMNCPSCSRDMTNMMVDAYMGASVDIDLCTTCQAFWFDKYESLKLAPASTLKLMKLIGEYTTKGKASLSSKLQCPRCDTDLLQTHDMQRNTRFVYWRCDNGHGRFISFFDFLKEKNFIRALSAEQIADLRKKIQIINCSNCGAPIDLTTASACAHCGSPISMLDMDQSQQLLNQLKHAAEPRPIDPALPLELAHAKRHIETLFGSHESDDDWWADASSLGLVEAGLSAVARWLTKAGL
jgi:Zn-finger nucleic acid-binding protein